MMATQQRMGTDVLKVWGGLIAAMSLGTIKEVLGVIALLVTTGYTLYKWISDLKKKDSK